MTGGSGRGGIMRGYVATCLGVTSYLRSGSDCHISGDVVLYSAVENVKVMRTPD
jgi:hypothetical protein